MCARRSLSFSPRWRLPAERAWLLGPWYTRGLPQSNSLFPRVFIVFFFPVFVVSVAVQGSSNHYEKVELEKCIEASIWRDSYAQCLFDRFFIQIYLLMKTMIVIFSIFTSLYVFKCRILVFIGVKFPLMDIYLNCLLRLFIIRSNNKWSACYLIEFIQFSTILKFCLSWFSIWVWLWSSIWKRWCL